MKPDLGSAGHDVSALVAEEPNKVSNAANQLIRTRFPQLLFQSKLAEIANVRNGPKADIRNRANQVLFDAASSAPRDYGVMTSSIW